MTVAAQAVQHGAEAWSNKDYAYLAAVIFSGLSLFFAFLMYRAALRRDKNSQGDSELKLFEIIAKAEKDWTDLNFEMNLIDKENDEKFITMQSKRSAYSQYVLNSYDMGCQRYLDDKLDKERFAKTYKARIHQLHSHDDFKSMLGMGDFKYAAISEVHTKLNNPEKQ